ncbi:prepilin peptidase [Roseimaritima ulvae]|uniref:Leader peptidase PppA n=1 Tax=Roseimaritima ulvae TaxID=980254 RepID=A0A5B9QI61_9BACT|nr:prepilin peptidase [Roseimaritima ulvae]QEG38554.1 Leader peptidase PppA [Roseimaritima ulvae]
MPKRRRWNRFLWIPLLAMTAVASLYVLLSAWILSRQSFLDFSDLLIPRVVDLVVLAWLFWVSSAIGSFLNVVAYRLPLGRGVGGFSSCPFCANKIATRDNIPVFGWLALQGRCRRCRLPIAPRYPIVELAVGLSLTLVGIMELYLAGINLPYQPGSGYSFGALHMPQVWTAAFAIGVCHMLAVACSWAVGLIRVDGVRLPRPLLVWCFVLVALPMLAWPPLQVVSWQVTVEPTWRANGFLSALLRVITGTAAAAVLARAMALSMFPSADIKLDPLGKDTARLLDLMAMLALPGIVVGWQGLLSVTILACLIAINLQRFLPNRDGFARLAIALPAALSLQLAAWRWLDALPYWPSTHAAPWVILLSAFAVATLSLWLRPQPVPPEREGGVGVRSEETGRQGDKESGRE